jgi:hypothetical protein
MKFLFRFGVAIGAVLLFVSASEAAPSQSRDVVSLANQWLGMTIAEFEQANQIASKGSIAKKTTSLLGENETILSAPFVPSLKDVEPASLNIGPYVFDESGHLIKIGSFFAQGYTFETVSDELTADYGPPVVKKTNSGFPFSLWTTNGIAIELLPAYVFVYRLPQRCTEALKATPPDQKLLEECGPP